MTGKAEMRASGCLYECLKNLRLHMLYSRAWSSACKNLQELQNQK